VIQVLARRTKTTRAHREPGVGKTAIVEALLSALSAGTYRKD
jgi:ATP-dependent Clp protease ATP-binding subunit ClpA